MSVFEVLCFALFGVSPLAYQLLAVLIGPLRRIGSVYSSLQFGVNWGMFTNQRETGFINVRTWGYCLRRADVIVEEKKFSSLPLLKFFDRHDFRNKAVAISIVEYLVNDVVDTTEEFDRFELVMYTKRRPATPARLFDRFAHDEFVRASYEREVMISCEV